jgi:hypothetical protein
MLGNVLSIQASSAKQCQQSGSPQPSGLLLRWEPCKTGVFAPFCKRLSLGRASGDPSHDWITSHSELVGVRRSEGGVSRLATLAGTPSPHPLL